MHSKWCIFLPIGSTKNVIKSYNCKEFELVNTAMFNVLSSIHVSVPDIVFHYTPSLSAYVASLGSVALITQRFGIRVVTNAVNLNVDEVQSIECLHHEWQLDHGTSTLSWTPFAKISIIKNPVQPMIVPSQSSLITLTILPMLVLVTNLQSTTVSKSSKSVTTSLVIKNSKKSQIYHECSL